ncbi:UTP--glucose-1-phosphate uridylyltransferase GalU [Campylobacter canadensis]|uniref:UTP--glucose-1-phosphate uridylyltransferase n=1 Tax=Campylobacter canadensis TaxID=449520 RepID=A0ABS7WU26_9BACT|nr:UTP--glucose-1-phosphate uridylyltransferase GalU [Campylobacter canadensis]MBZ7987529.1 UTP--glucose-1-phosphate uridylyltransferase GalU [Campylobacter canadensis]MBZ7994874.1 UTP--glucose-1-phosphate uridylyltransferase GalU [Campylobacter canadensis]MBZ7996739.1 UTP--glucose-1-phosphate uridylyltransferase GalU [Campylobacter canadensis]MBZ7998715.1 UTP--glucose-1-phosphate uridylyltransferase GalU [Campylobacter canadensis]MBZ8000291.1 UTP--glucose-1-phosphate uridylyltransferase GalU 
MIKTCIFPAAGYGTRFLPATKTLPKEMLPILNKPLIHYGLDEAISAGMTNIGIVSGRTKRALEDYFDISYEIEDAIAGSSKEELLNDVREQMKVCEFMFVRQRKMNGLGDAIHCAKNIVNNEAFGVILADDLCVNDKKSVMQQMAEVYEKYKCSVVALMQVEKEDVNKYGIIEGDKIEDNIYQITNMVEKPEPKDAKSNLAIIGRYILTPDIFEKIENTSAGKGGEIQITDALNKQAKLGKCVGLVFDGLRFDCGNVKGFFEATKYFYNKLYT